MTEPKFELGAILRISRGCEIDSYDQRCDDFNQFRDFGMEGPTPIGVIEILGERESDDDIDSNGFYYRVVGRGVCDTPMMGLARQGQLEPVTPLEALAVAETIPWPDDLPDELRCSLPACQGLRNPNMSTRGDHFLKLCNACRDFVFPEGRRCREGATQPECVKDYMKRSVRECIEFKHPDCLTELRVPYESHLVGNNDWTYSPQVTRVMAIYKPKGVAQNPAVAIAQDSADSIAESLIHSEDDEATAPFLLLGEREMRAVLTAISHVAPDLIDEVHEEMQDLA